MEERPSVLTELAWAVFQWLKSIFPFTFFLALGNASF